MAESAVRCSAAESETTVKRVLRVAAAGVLVWCSLVLVAASRSFAGFQPNLAGFAHIVLTLSALTMLGTSLWAFRDRVRASRWFLTAAIVALAAFLVNGFAQASDGGTAHLLAMLFGLLIVSIVVANWLRKDEGASACNCGH